MRLLGQRRPRLAAHFAPARERRDHVVGRVELHCVAHGRASRRDHPQRVRGDPRTPTRAPTASTCPPGEPWVLDRNGTGVGNVVGASRNAPQLLWDGSPSLGTKLSVKVAVRRRPAVLCAKWLRRSGEWPWTTHSTPPKSTNSIGKVAVRPGRPQRAHTRRVAHVARLFADAGVVSVVSLVSPKRRRTGAPRTRAPRRRRAGVPRRASRRRSRRASAATRRASTPAPARGSCPASRASTRPTRRPSARTSRSTPSARPRRTPSSACSRRWPHAAPRRATRPSPRKKKKKKKKKPLEVAEPGGGRPVRGRPPVAAR